MNKCKCEWRGQRVIALCDAHEQAFRQRARNLSISPETKRSTEKQVQAVRERLRKSPYPVQPGDTLYNAQGKAVAVVRELDPKDITISMTDDLGVEHRWSGGQRIVIKAEGFIADDGSW